MRLADRTTRPLAPLLGLALLLGGNLVGCNAIVDFDRFRGGGGADGGAMDGAPEDDGGGRADTGPCEDPTTETCNDLDDDCDGDVDEDFMLSENPENCGACDRVCPSVPNSEPGCADSDCSPVCNTGFGDCDLDYLTGCEADLTGADHCGTCGNACAEGTFCSSGSCVSDCPPNEEVCGRSCIDTRSDLNNCGDCDVVCPTPPNAIPICTTGSCGFTCEAGFDDCNDDPADGCETDLSTVTNCGTCGTACNFANAVPTCNTDGVCAIEACLEGFDDCNGDSTDGCEADLTSVESCGSCTTACTDPTNGSATCGESGCETTCDDGYADCDGNGTCEADLTTAATCGDCGTSCSAPTPICGATGCVSSCSGAETLCSGSCVDTTTSVNHCGGCGSPCPAPDHASPVCASSSCDFICDPGWADCNTDPSDGCERNIRTLTDCGGCGTVCDLANASESCSTGTCLITACDSGFGDCTGGASDGCETPLTTTTNCASCGNGCSVTGGTAGCSGTACTVASCNAGLEDCDGVYGNGCEETLGTYYRDVDNDTYGDDAVTSTFCAMSAPAGWVTRGGDCAPNNGTVFPQPNDLCDGTIDHDCDEMIDEGCDCSVGETRNCGSDVGECEFGTETCTGGAWGSCTGGVGPTMEICDGLDNNCSGAPDETFACTPGQTMTCTTTCGSLGSRTCQGPGTSAPCTFPSTCTAPSESCNGVDDDCDGEVDEGVLGILAAATVDLSSFLDATTGEADIAYNVVRDRFGLAFSTSSPQGIGIGSVAGDAGDSVARMLVEAPHDLVRVVPFGSDYLAMWNEPGGSVHYRTFNDDLDVGALDFLLEGTERTTAWDAYTEASGDTVRVIWTDGDEMRWYVINPDLSHDIRTGLDPAPPGTSIYALSLFPQRNEWSVLVSATGDGDVVIWRRLDGAGSTRRSSGNLMPAGFTASPTPFRSTRIAVRPGAGPLFMSDRVAATFRDRDGAGADGFHLVLLDGAGGVINTEDLGRSPFGAGVTQSPSIGTFAAVFGRVFQHRNVELRSLQDLGLANEPRPVVLGGPFRTGFYAATTNNSTNFEFELIGCR